MTRAATTTRRAHQGGKPAPAPHRRRAQPLELGPKGADGAHTVKLRARNLELRGVTIERSGLASPSGQQTYRFAVSSETPCEGWYGAEVLVHEAGAAILDRANGGSIRDNHYGPQLGVSQSAEIGSDRRLYVDGVYFSRTQAGQELELDVKDQVRRNVSVRVIPREGELRQIDEDGTQHWFWTLWEYVHTAFVPDPADATVGPTRGMDDDEEYEVRVFDRTMTPGGRKERRMPPTKKSAATNGSSSRTRDQRPDIDDLEDRELDDDVEDRSLEGNDAPRDRAENRGNRRDRDDDSRDRTRDEDPAERRRAERAAERRRIEVTRDREAERKADQETIRGWVKERGIDAETAMRWAQEELTADEVARELMDRAASDAKKQPPSDRSGHSDQEMGRYSVRRAVAAAAKLIKFDGLEREVHDDMRNNLSNYRSFQGGVLMPVSRKRRYDENGEEVSTWSQRDRALDTKTAGKGAELVQPGGLEFLDQLRNDTVLLKAGATVMPGLKQPIPFVRKTGNVTVTCLGQGQTIQRSDAKFVPLELGPKRWGGAQQYSRELLMTASLAVDDMITRDLSEGHGIAIDAQGIVGVGGAFPLGLLNLPDLQTLAMGGGLPTWLKVTQMPGKTQTKNALRGAGLGWIATSMLAASLQATPKVAGAAAGFIWENGIQEGQMAGYSAYGSNQMPSNLGGGTNEHGLLFGPFQDVIIGMFGPLELMPDPYSGILEGMVQVVSYQLADVLVTYPEAFVLGTGIVVA